jgi:hypothetical protein
MHTMPYLIIYFSIAPAVPTGPCIHPAIIVMIYPITAQDLPSYALVLGVATVTAIVGWTAALLGLGAGQVRSHVEVGKRVITG